MLSFRGDEEMTYATFAGDLGESKDLAENVEGKRFSSNKDETKRRWRRR